MKISSRCRGDVVSVLVLFVGAWLGPTTGFAPQYDHRRLATPCQSTPNGEDIHGHVEDEDPLAKQRRRILEEAVPELPSVRNKPPSKSEIYDPADLANLWDIHQQLTSQKGEPELSEDDVTPSLHDLVMQAVSQVDTNVQEEQHQEEDSSTSYSWLTPEIKERAARITAVASDVDGTLIGSDQKVNPRTRAAIQLAVKAAFSPIDKLQYFFPATGKTRKGAMNSLGPELAALLRPCPGVFIQGLYCVYNDQVVFEKKLESGAVSAVEQLVADTGTSIIAYDGDNLYTTDLTPNVRDLHEIYGEPLSQEIPSLTKHSPGMHKVLVCDADTEKLAKVVRPQLEAVAAANNARVTQAMPTMLELLPEGCSKALGVQKLCEVLGIDPATSLLALGDAENDTENLQMAALGVCMGNGSPVAKEAADIVLKETADEGAAGLAMEVLLGLD